MSAPAWPQGGDASGAGGPQGASGRTDGVEQAGFEAVIGLEVHCELKTATKLFCGCRNAFGDEPNTNVCPVCLGLPGSLPVLNEQAVELAMAIGVALGCELRPSVFHRKHYFYPDMPKDYQISQYDEPLAVGGSLELADGTRVGIVRAHLEEDTGKITHIGGGGRIHEASYALVDYNRAGVPLVEIVSAPDLRSPAQARVYVEELRDLVVAVGASDGKMEEGSLRVDANVSVRPLGSQQLGTRCEVKNLNSLRSLVRALEYEIARQCSLLASGKHVEQETRHYDEEGDRTVALRSKEEAYDYRYFPEPDLVTLDPDPAWQERVRARLPRLPAERRRRLVELLGRPPSAAELDQVRTVVRLGLDAFVERAAARGIEPARALARSANELASHGERALALDPDAFATLLRMEAQGSLSATQAKAVLGVLVERGGDPEAVARQMGLEAIAQDELEALVDQALQAHPSEWERYVAGEDKLAQFFVGQVMRATKGRADGSAVAALLARRRGAAGGS